MFKLLIIRLSSIGDVLLTTPLIRVLKKKFPNCRIDFVIKKEYSELIACHPALTKIYIFDKKSKNSNLREIKSQLKQERYDIIVDIHKNLRSFYLRTHARAHRIVKYKKYYFRRWVLVNLKLDIYNNIIPVYQRYIDSLTDFHLEYDHAGLDLYFPASIFKKIEEQWNDKLHKKYNLIVGIAPGASFFTKRWPLDGFIEVAQYLIAKFKAALLLFGNEQDRIITTEISSKIKENIFDFAGKLSLLETAAMMNYCHLVITNDSGLMHVATALNKKVVAVFGSTTEQLGFFPFTTNSIIVQNKELKCRPCSHIGRSKCPKNHFKCMIDLKAQQVIAAINSLLLLK